MSSHSRDHRKVSAGLYGMPAKKKQKIETENKLDDDDDPFADDITGEELEFVASQAEMRHTIEKKRHSAISTPQSAMQNPNAFKFKQPQIGKAQNSSSRLDPDKLLLKELQEKLSVYETTINDLRNTCSSKRGETMLLRDRLLHAEKKIQEEKMKIVEMEKSQQEQEKNQEKLTQKRIEKYKDDVRFKDMELQESQTLIQNLESKLKALEQQNSVSKSQSPKKSVITNCSDDLPGTSQMASNSCVIAPGVGCTTKKIRLVKPESPRLSSIIASQKVEFSDDLFGDVKPTKDPAKHHLTASKSQEDNMQGSNRVSSTEHTLKSKLFSKDTTGQRILRCILADRPTSDSSNTCQPPILPLFGNDSDNLRHYLASNHTAIRLFNPCKDQHTIDNALKTMPIIQKHIHLFFLLQNLVIKDSDTSQSSSAYHTAQSAPENDDCFSSLKKLKRFSLQEKKEICKNMTSSLNLLKIYCENIHDFCNEHEVQKCFINLVSLCNFNCWSPFTEFFDDILLLVVQILTVSLLRCNAEKNIVTYESVIKNDIMLPLVTYKNPEVQVIIMEFLTCVITSYPMFGTSLVCSEDDQPSVLCHVLDILSSDGSLNLDLITKALRFISIFMAKQPILLKNKECYGEIYHGIDSLLYHLLVTWKNESSQPNKRLNFVIKSALCLLHSCTNVYPDEIPGSRRQCSHQTMLIYLNEFLQQEGDPKSFWCNELSKIVKSEVESLFNGSDL